MQKPRRHGAAHNCQGVRIKHPLRQQFFFYISEYRLTEKYVVQVERYKPFYFN